MMKIIYALFLLLFLISPCLGDLATIILQWDANSPPPTAYELYQRQEGQEYDYNKPIWRGTATTCTVEYDTSKTYYYAVRALKFLTSGDSNEVIHPKVVMPPYSLGGKDLNGLRIIHGRSCKWYKIDKGTTQQEVDACIQAGTCRFCKSCGGK